MTRMMTVLMFAGLLGSTTLVRATDGTEQEFKELSKQNVPVQYCATAQRIREGRCLIVPTQACVLDEHHAVMHYVPGDETLLVAGNLAKVIWPKPEDGDRNQLAVLEIDSERQFPLAPQPPVGSKTKSPTDFSHVYVISSSNTEVVYVRTKAQRTEHFLWIEDDDEKHPVLPGACIFSGGKLISIVIGYAHEAGESPIFAQKGNWIIAVRPEDFESFVKQR